MTTRWWHAYGGPHPDGYFMTVVAGPTEQDENGVNQKGVPIKKIAFVDGGKYLASFDHEPTALEKDHLQPEEFWQWDESGDETPWNEED